MSGCSCPVGAHDTGCVLHGERATELVAAAQKLLPRLADIPHARAERDRLIADMRALGWGYDRIADMFGLSKQGVAVIVRTSK